MTLWLIPALIFSAAFVVWVFSDVNGSAAPWKGWWKI